ncbi:MAG: DNA mismatch repair endonuclease MutL [Bacilli bacterium]|nr:DNA mismatch repair endonuclease MutL [Bacilli bacterium]
MGKIIQLDQLTTNRIAAGEVIERVASVVKELVENSIDAEATMIKVHLLEGGLQEIMVVDDGTGMDYNDAKMAIMPHATSKIKDSDDLFRIHTLGFRGEALPSIVSVSTFKLKTSIDGVRGMMYTVKGGALVSEAMVASPKGTEITVRNLFYNTPARLQTLQSANVELSYITDYLTKTAMARSNIAFTLTNNDKVIFQTYGNGEVLEVVLASYGTEVAKSMLDVFNDNGYFKIKGYISSNQATRSSKSHIAICVNGRIVKNAAIVNAVMNAYEGFLVGGRYPIVLLDIAVDVALVDVNVHPGKLEVRFSNESELLVLITSTLRDRLKNAVLIPTVNLPQHEEAPFVLKEEVLIDSFEEQNDGASPEQAIAPEEAIALEQESMEEDQEFEEFLEDHELDADEESFNDAFQEDTPHEVKEERVVSETPQEKPIYTQQEYQLTDGASQFRNANHLPKMHYIGQLFGTYIIAQAEDEFYLIDQHAAAERINYEKIVKELQKEDILTYELLVPLKIDFSQSEAMLIQEHKDLFVNLSIPLEDFGSGSFTIRSLPTWIPQGREKEFVEGIAMEVLQHHKKEKWQFIDDLAKELACKKSIKANEYHNIMEMEYLLDDLAKAQQPYTCPHGRPVIIKFSKSEMERWFKRVV